MNKDRVYVDTRDSETEHLFYFSVYLGRLSVQKLIQSLDHIHSNKDFMFYSLLFSPPPLHCKNKTKQFTTHKKRTTSEKKSLTYNENFHIETLKWDILR